MRMDHIRVRAGAEMKMPTRAPVPFGVNVAVGGAGERAPESRTAEDDEHASTRPLGIHGERRWQDPSASEREDDSDAEQKCVAARKLKGRANDPDPTDASAAMNRQRGDGHEVIGAQSMQKSEQKRRTAEENERHRGL
jgi:hypothetical protein